MKLQEVMEEERKATEAGTSFMCIDEYMPKDKRLLPMDDKVLILCFPEEETYKNDSGVVLYKAPVSMDDVKPCIGRVVALGGAVEETWILGRLVYYGTHAGAKFVVEGETYKCLKECDLYCCDVNSLPTE